MTFLPITLTAHVTRLADYHLRQDSRRPAIPPIYRPISGPVVAEQRAEQREERRWWNSGLGWRLQTGR